MGCAGWGILTAFDFLNKYHYIENMHSHMMYGDVVCGGFGFLSTKQYADGSSSTVSGEMSIYAANNILCGIKNLNLRQTDCRDHL